MLEWIAVAWTPSAKMQGIAPFGEDIALLAYVLEEGSSVREAQAPGNGQAGDARRPEVRPYESSASPANKDPEAVKPAYCVVVVCTEYQDGVHASWFTRRRMKQIS